MNHIPQDLSTQMLDPAGVLPSAVSCIAGFQPYGTSDALTAWSIALVSAVSADRATAEGMIAHAAAMNPHAIAAIVEAEEDPWYWFGREELEGSEDQADQIACLHGATWSAYPEAKQLLVELQTRYAAALAERTTTSVLH